MVDIQTKAQVVLLREAKAEIEKLRSRLEMSDEHGVDGIAARDAIIAEQDKLINQITDFLATRDAIIAERDKLIVQITALVLGL